MRASYGAALRSFANSIDILRDDEFKSVLSATKEYLENNFNVTTVERLSEVVSEGIPKLAPSFGDDQYDLYPVRNEDGTPNGISSAAFTTKRNLWVTPDDGLDQTLIRAEKLQDRWDPDRDIDLPTYLDVHDADDEPIGGRVKTLISIPIRRRGSTIALVYFESEDVLVPSDRAKDEFAEIAKSLAWLYDLNVHNRETRDATEEEIRALEKASRETYDWRPVVSLFFAYPGDGESDVNTALAEILQDRASQNWFTLDDWAKNKSGGRIPAEIEGKIRSAAYFVAYLSEPSGAVGDHAPRYVDNPNVLYEAGVFQGLVDDTNRSNNWLLIREKSSPEPPFDIGTFNTLIVPRDDQGTLEPEFEQQPDGLERILA